MAHVVLCLIFLRKISHGYKPAGIVFLTSLPLITAGDIHSHLSTGDKKMKFAFSRKAAVQAPETWILTGLI